ncbi:MAG: hypothetical protein ACKO4A_05670, partial [Gammaproteobacteria bacterium]
MTGLRAPTLLLALLACAAPAFGVEIRVRDVTGTPLAGVMVTRNPVEASTRNTRDSADSGSRALAEARITRFSDASGTLRFDDAVGQTEYRAR